MDKLQEEIRDLCKENDAVIMAHYYTDACVQEIADYVGDSFFLARKIKEIKEKKVVFCGVTFMGEAATVLDDEKIIIMPDTTATCPMALMVSEEKIRQMRKEYDDLAIVCYINSTAKIKALSDICVTSSNAVKIVKNLPNKHIFFIPDKNLGAYVKAMCPEKNVILNSGYCHVHENIDVNKVRLLKKDHPDAEILVHPECNSAVCDMADFLGSTKDIIEYATNSARDEFIICTEMGISYELSMRNPSKKFYFPDENMICPDMKKITLQKIRKALTLGMSNVSSDSFSKENAKKALDNMLDMASKVLV